MTEPAREPERPPCEKRGYTSRRKAREAHQTAGFRVREYFCTRGCRAWHVTNEDKNVIKGDGDRIRRRRRIADLRDSEERGES